MSSPNIQQKPDTSTPAKRISKTRATKLVREVRKALSELAPTVVELYEGQAWIALGYADWSTLIRQEFGGPLMLPKPERVEAVAILTESGMSNRAVGETLGVTEITVRRDRSTAPHGAVAHVRCSDFGASHEFRHTWYRTRAFTHAFVQRVGPLRGKDLP